MKNSADPTTILFITKKTIEQRETYEACPKSEYTFNLSQQLAFYGDSGWKIIILSNEDEAQEPSAKFTECVRNAKKLMERLTAGSAYIDEYIFCTEPKNTTGEIAYALREGDRWPRCFGLPHNAIGMRMPHPGMLLHVLKAYQANPEDCLFVAADIVEARTGKNANVPCELVADWMETYPPRVS